ncbi:MAG: PqiC family protein [Betaproteobacteria bacterium]
MTRFGRATFSRRCVLCATVALQVVLAGCAGVPAEYFYTLSATVPAQQATTANPAWNAGIVVETATIPEAVDRPQLVVSAGENRIVILEQQRWAEPLKAQIARTVAVNLARLLGTARVSAYPQTADGDAAYRVTLDLQGVDARRGEAVMLEVSWTLRGPAGAALRSGRSMLRETVASDGYDALVAAWSKAIAGLSGDIAAALRAVQAPA